jgi:hypothetical protein
MDDDAVKSLCDAAMLAGIRYARQHGIEMTGDISTRFLNALRLAVKAALAKAIDDGRENPQLIPLLANALKDRRGSRGHRGG